MYKCIYCNFETNDSGNYSRHKVTKKHLSNLKNDSDKVTIEKEYETLKNKMKEMEIEYKHKMELLEKEKDKEIEKLEAVIKVYKEQGAKTINNTQNNTINIGALNYVNEHFKDAPPLEKISNFIINGIDTNDVSQHDKFIKDIIYYNNNKILHEYLGDHIVDLYKKNDLNKQSFHTTDTSRLNYVVRIIENSNDLNSNNSEQDYSDSDSEDDRYNYINEETIDPDHLELINIKKQYEKQLKLINKKKEYELVKAQELENNKKIWTTDKNGYKICKLLIDPTVKQLVSILKRKLKVKTKSKSKNINLQDEMEFYQTINNILESIDTNKLKKDINKYIAPKFNLDKKKNKN
jgi:hypothetical protein